MSLPKGVKGHIKVDRCGFGCGFGPYHQEFKLACNHLFCPYELKNFVVEMIRNGTTIYGVPCPKCQFIIDEFILRNLLGPKFQEYAMIQEGLEKNAKITQIHQEHEAYQSNSPLLVCPNCKRYGHHSFFDDLFTCPFCEFIYCIKCLKESHEGACEESELSKPQGNKTQNDPQNRKNESLNSGNDAVALKKEKIDPNYMEKMDIGPQDDAQMRTYEKEFYSPSEENTLTSHEITRMEISEAFVQDEKCKPWPWEKVQDGNIPAEYPPPFESLNPRRWIEDEHIEKAIKNYMLVLCKYNSRPFTILESFLFRWGLSHNNMQFINAIQEKNLLSRKLVVSLMNSDLSGSGGHWILGVIDVWSFKILILDSSRVDSISYYENFFFYLLHALYVASQGLEVKFDPNVWDLCIMVDAAQQSNSFDCGAMTLANLVALTLKRELNISPDGNLLRRWIYDLLQNENKVGENVGQVTPNESFQLPLFQPKKLKIRRVCQNNIYPQLLMKKKEGKPGDVEETPL